MLTKILGYISFGFVCGILLQSLISPHEQWFIVATIVFCISVLAYIISLGFQNVLYLSLCLLGLGFGILRYSFSVDTYEAHILDTFAEHQKSITMVGLVKSEPLISGSRNSFVLHIEYIQGRTQDFPVSTKVLVHTYEVNEYEYGQRIMVTGKIQKPSSFETDTGRMFDYQSYLNKNDIYYTSQGVSVRVVGPGTQSLQRGLYRLKHKFLDALYERIPKPESGLLAGILFGQDAALDRDTEDNFRKVGLMHIVVLSGYNVSLVIITLMVLLGFLPLRVRSIFIVCGIVCFALLVGAGPTVLRASIMAFFIVLGRLVGMRYDVRRALFIAGFIMIIINPQILVFDISFQLSFLASYGLIYGARILEPYFAFLPDVLLIRESALTSVSAQIFVLPLILYSIGEFSVIAPLVNILVLFIVPVTMLVGFGASFVQLFSPVIATVFVYPSIYLLKYQLFVVNMFAKIPFATFRVPVFSFVWVIIMYIGIFYFFQYLEKKQLQNLKV